MGLNSDEFKRGGGADNYDVDPNIIRKDRLKYLGRDDNGVRQWEGGNGRIYNPVNLQKEGIADDGSNPERGNINGGDKSQQWQYNPPSPVTAPLAQPYWPNPVANSKKVADDKNVVGRMKLWAGNSGLANSGILDSKGKVLESKGIVTKSVVASQDKDYTLPGVPKRVPTKTERFINNPYDVDPLDKDDDGNDDVPFSTAIGTRVFKYHDQNYDRPRYTHNDGSRNVFFCYQDTALRKVVDILKENPGTGIFDTDELKEYGAWYDLDSFEAFAEQNMDLYAAVYDDKDEVSKRKNHRLNGKKWTTKGGEWKPTAEVVMRNAISGAHVKPAGIEIHIDKPGAHPPNKEGLPNVSTADADPLFGQKELLSGKWTQSTIHIHPVGAKVPFDRNGYNPGDKYIWDQISNNKSRKYDGYGGLTGMIDLKTPKGLALNIV